MTQRTEEIKAKLNEVRVAGNELVNEYITELHALLTLGREITELSGKAIPDGIGQIIVSINTSIEDHKGSIQALQQRLY